MPTITRKLSFILAVCSLICACEPGEPGEQGEQGTSCTIKDNGDGTKTISCEDGTEAIVYDGQDGTACTAKDNGDGTETISCEDGTEFVVHDGTSCTVTDNEDGTYLLSCEDGTEVVVSDGDNGGGCSVNDNRDGTYTLSCADGSEVVISDGEDGTESPHCLIYDNEDGTATLECPDSEPIVVPMAGDTGSAVVLQGSYTIENSLDLLFLQPYSEITGDLTVATAGLTDIALPNLEKVGGKIVAEFREGLVSLEFPALVEAGGLCTRYNDELTALDFSQLQLLAGNGKITNNAALENLDLSSLKEIGGSLMVGGTALAKIDLSALEKTGYLEIDAQGQQVLALPHLVVVENGMTIGGKELTEVALPKLTQIGKELSLGGPELVQLSAPLLKEVGGIKCGSGSTSTNLGKLDTMGFPSLEFVGGYLSTENCHGPKNLHLPSLVEVESLELHNEALTTVQMPKLEAILQHLELVETSVAELAFPVLASVGSELRVIEATSLESIMLPTLTKIGDKLQIGGNAKLSELDVPELDFVGESFNVYNNPVLPACEVEALLAQLGQEPSYVSLSGNNEEAVCD